MAKKKKNKVKTNNQNNSYKSAQFILEKSTDYLLIKN